MLNIFSEYVELEAPSVLFKSWFLIVAELVKILRCPAGLDADPGWIH